MRRLISLLLLLALLTSCGGSDGELPTIAPVPGPSGDTSGPATISFAVSDYERPIFETLVTKFTAENPDIKVVLVPIDDLLDYSSGNAPSDSLSMLRRIVSGADTSSTNYIGASREMQTSNLLLDLAPLMDADASFQRDDFYPGALEQVTIDNRITVLPRYFNAQILSYNKELFAQAGLPEPKAGWTWLDLLGAAQQIGKPGSGVGRTYGFLDMSGGISTLLSILKEKNIDILTIPSKDVQVDSPEIVQAFEQLQEMIKNNVIYIAGFSRPMGPNSSDEDIDPQTVIREGRIGIWPDDMGIIYADGQPQYESLSYETGKVPYPAGNETFRASGFEGYFISSGTQYPNQAWKWIEFLSRQSTEIDGRSSFIPGRIPARESLAQTTGFWEALDPAAAEAYRQTLASASSLPPQPADYLAISALWQVSYQLVSEPNADVQKLLTDAQNNLNQELAQIELTPTPTPDTSPVLVATPEPDVAPEGSTLIVFNVPGYNPSELRRLARTFREQNPQYFVQIRSTQSFTEPLDIQKLANTSDCFTWYTLPQSEAEINPLLDLQPLFDADNAFPRDDYPPALLSAYQSNGKLFGLPIAFNLRTLNYNRTAFDAAGIQPPTVNWTPDDFLAAAQALTKGQGESQQFGYVPLNGVLSDMFFFTSQFGTSMTLGAGEDIRPNFDDPRLIEAVQWYLDLSLVHKVMPEIKISYRRDDPGYDDRSWEYAQNGRAGMWFAQGPIFNYVDPNNPQSFEEGVAPLPLGRQGLSTSDFYTRGLHISAQSPNAQGCWEWFKFLSGTTTETMLQGGIPARISIAQSEGFAAQATEGQVELYQAYSDVLKREGRTGGSLDYMYGQMDLYWFYQALDRVLTGKGDLTHELTEAQKTTLAYQDCLKQYGKPLKLATCANQVDPTYQGYNTEDMTDNPVIGIPLG